MIPSTFFVNSLDFQVRHILSLISLCLLLLEYVGTCQFEFTYIWSRPLTISKVLYVISRYYDIMCKIANYFLVHLFLGRSPSGVSPHRCAIWYTFLFFGSTLMLLILDIILFLRVYALYRTKLSVLIFAIPLATPYVFGIMSTWDLWAHQEVVFDGTCNALAHHPKLNIALGASFIISHLIIWIGGYARRNVGYGHVPVVRLVVIEGTWVFVVLFAIDAALMPHSIAVKATNPFLALVCPSTLFSILNCRIIQNMHNLAINESARNNTCDDQDFQLTTFLQSEFGPEN